MDLREEPIPDTIKIGAIKVNLVKFFIMSIAEKKEFLLHTVEDADEKLTGLLIALANEYNASGENYSPAEIEEFYKIRDGLLAEPQTGYIPEGTHKLIRNKR